VVTLIVVSVSVPRLRKKGRAARVVIRIRLPSWCSEKVSGVNYVTRPTEVTMPVRRVWHGWTSPANADAYHRLLLDEVFPGIEAKGIPGYVGIELLRKDHDSEVEFVTIMTFESLTNVIDFQGEDYERAYVPASAQRVLSRWDERSAHYEVLEERMYG
jgi:heme-degrading monooxygenase HmoA